MPKSAQQGLVEKTNEISNARMDAQKSQDASNAAEANAKKFEAAIAQGEKAMHQMKPYGNITVKILNWVVLQSPLMMPRILWFMAQVVMKVLVVLKVPYLIMIKKSVL